MDEYNYIENLEEFIHTFVDLPQPRQTPSGHPNHWHFSFQPYPGPRDLSILFIVNPYAGLGHNAGVLDLPRWHAETSVERMSKLWLILILRTFARPHVGQMRPWSWSTGSSFMVDLMTDALLCHRHQVTDGHLVDGDGEYCNRCVDKAFLFRIKLNGRLRVRREV